MTSNELIDIYVNALNDLISVDVAYGNSGEVILKGRLRDELLISDSLITDRMAELPGNSQLLSSRPNIVIKVQVPGEIGKRNIPWLNIVLFILTVFSTILSGAGLEGIDVMGHPQTLWQNPLHVLIAGIPFSFALLGILVCHEFGHYIMSRRNGVKVSLPYFVPFPNFVGTLGAVIRSKSPFINRRQLLEVGATGPLAGVVVAIPLIIWGTAHPRFIPDPGNAVGMINLGSSLLISLIDKLFSPNTPAGYIAISHPVAFAGWVGLLVTMLNLMPISQFDGGHILYALFGKLQHKLAYVFMAILVVLSFYWIGWLIWIGFGLLLRPNHPPTVLDDIPLERKHKIIGYVCILIFILCFMPVPLSIISS
jgi:membrane-associated protease RseP (regulator of RpoE activity)